MKAEVLAAARRRVRGADVPRLVHFSLREWRRQPRAVLRRIAALDGTVAVRSSARDEDVAGASHAGHYRSLLDVSNEPGALKRAIERVAAPLAADAENHVLVQAMARNVVTSGVITTYDPATGAPYYVIEYDHSARTDTVTAGLVVPTAAAVFRGTALRDVRAAPLRRLLRVAREIERWWRGVPLELEFAIDDDGRVALLQVRRLAMPPRPVSTRRVAARLAAIARVVEGPTLALDGAAAAGRTILAQMSDWNPAELIGVHPAPLAASIFAALISDDVWQRARASMGYRALPGVPLMRLVGGRPYVDVRASFTSFVPAPVSPAVTTALVHAWLQRLGAHPELHDKVELEVAQTAVDFTFVDHYRARSAGALRHRDYTVWAEALRALTADAVTTAARGSLARALAASADAAMAAAGRARAATVGPDAARATGARRDAAPRARLARAFRLLAACRRGGTLPFAIVARHAFIAEALLRSAVERGAWSEMRSTAFRRSLVTVARELACALNDVAAGRATRAAFLRRYGHVRPSSFDITSLRYDRRAELFHDLRVRDADLPGVEPFVLTARERRALATLASEARLTISADELLRYAATAIIGRERVKLELSRMLSEALECLAEWGVAHDLARADVACFTLDELQAPERATPAFSSAACRALVAERRAARALDGALRLSPLLRDAADLYVPPALPALPTFVTTRSVAAAPVLLHGAASAPKIAGRVVCIESADPGFDWIFAHPIAALVTRFGGGNSHMAIRCVEAAVPAAIGVGEELFTRVRGAHLIELRCAERVVRIS